MIKDQFFTGLFYFKKNSLYVYIKEFRNFIARGNVIDLAVGVVIGAAFGKIVDSLVNDILLSPISLAIDGVNISDLKWTIRQAVVENGAEIKSALSLKYRNFIQMSINFLIIAFVIFIWVVKPMNKLKQKIERDTTAPTTPEDIQLLREIRDSLKKINYL